MKGLTAALLLVFVLVAAGQGIRMAGAQGVPSGPLAEEYRLAVDDSIQIVVDGHEELGRDYLVPAFGEVSFPPLGRVGLVGRTLRELEEEIRDRLKKSGQLTDPRVFVVIKDYAPRQAFLIGAVTQSISLPVHRRYGILEVLALAGASPADTDYKGVKIIRRREGGEPFQFAVNVEDIMAGDFRKNVVVMPNDVILLPNFRDQSRAAYLYVLGHVNRPGRVVYDPGREPMTLTKLISHVGGYSQYARSSRTKILRKEGNRTIGFEIDFDDIIDLEIQDFVLQPNDFIYVPQSPL